MVNLKIHDNKVHKLYKTFKLISNSKKAFLQLPCLGTRKKFIKKFQTHEKLFFIH